MNWKSPAAGQSRCRRRFGNRRGIALISVLAVLILLTVLVVAFLMRAEVARTSSANYRATTGTRLLADTVLNLVQAEINDATTYTSGGTAPYTWASQPGAIRVYDSTGALQKIYRLYSAPSLTTSLVTDVLDASGNSAEITGTGTTGWSNPARWVDLNAPITVTDPSAPASSYVIYPILDNRNPANTAQCVPMPGFFVNTVGASPVFPTANTTTLNQPYMPVQWLYTLANGQIVAPTGGTGTIATFTPPNAPTAANPIVGRVAFWTDDDTCKVNINTAAGSVSFRADQNSNGILVSDGGVFFSTAYDQTGNAWAPASWDIPRYGGSWEDLKLMAADQPVQGEYQRYPGHPATTILYYILRALAVTPDPATAGFSMPEILTDPINGGLNPYAFAYTPTGAGANTQDSGSGGNLPWPYTSTLFGILPRYNDNGGSQGGIADTSHAGATTSLTNNIAITPKRNRLYTALGELLYSTSSTGTAPPARTRNGKLNTSSPQTPTSPYFTRQQLETGKFFLTTHSRSPETTLFGTPRVAMWPIPDTTRTSTEGKTMTQTAFDKLIAFCSTTNTGSGGTPHAYYFQRYDRASATNDWTNEARNQAVYGYLQDLTSAKIPGYGPSGGVNSLLAKYGVGVERDQILTEIVDYIRCTNLNDHSNPAGVNFATNGEVIPLQITKSGTTTSGLGRLLTLSEIGLHVICTADANNNLGSVNAGNTNPDYKTTYLSSTATGTCVVYNTPKIVPAVSATIPVSPVIGSASDPAYVSNLPVPQFLRLLTGTGSDGNPGTIVDLFGNSSPPVTPFPANPTLSTSGTYSTSTSDLAALNIGSKQLQAMVIFELAAPMNGFDQISAGGGKGPDVNILVTNIENIVFETGASASVVVKPFPNTLATTSSVGPNVNGNGYLNGTGSAGTGTYANGWVNNGDSDQGGIFGFRFPMAAPNPTAAASAKSVSASTRCNGWSGVGALTTTSTSGTDTLGTSPTTQWTPFTGTTIPYRFVSNPFTVTTAGLTVGSTVSGFPGNFNVALTIPVTVSGVTTQVPYQNFNVTFPAVGLSTPTLSVNGFTARYTSSNNNTYTTHAPDWWSFDNRIGWCSEGSPFYALSGSGTSTTIGFGAVIRGDVASATAFGAAGAWKWGTTGASITTTSTSFGDVVRTMIPKDGDYRMTMAKPTVSAAPTISTAADFSVPPLYNSAALSVNMFMEPNGSQGTTGTDVSGSLIPTGTTVLAPASRPKVPSLLSTGTPTPQSTWDWDTGTAGRSDGAYANKPDEGSDYVGGGVIPYINSGNQASNSLTSYYTANRIVNSPVMFGSLPTGVAENIPWRTLLFRPQLTTTQTGSVNLGRNSVASPPGPKDYLLLDNFWMPVVQPYAISEPFSTAGKINMNYQILPFTYITRSTAVQAVLASELVARVPLKGGACASGSATASYQGGGLFQTESTSQSGLWNAVKTGSPTLPTRLPLNLSDVNGSLRQFKEKFNSGDLFHSPAEICDIYLVPKDSMNPGFYANWTTNAIADAAWYGSDFALVGDNVREHAYGDLYPRLTTKSNTYTVYYKVQVLKNPPNANQAQWDESSGVVTGEYRGSTSLERYLDPNNNSIPDFTVSTKNPAVDSSQSSLDNYYQWRTVANNAFAP